MEKKRAEYIQGLLHANGHHLTIDGDWGNLSQTALDDFAKANNLPVLGHGKISQKVLDALRKTVPKRTIASTNRIAKIQYRTSTNPELPRSTNFNEMVRFYGHPDRLERDLVRVYPAYQLKYGTQSVGSIRVHKKAKTAFENAFKLIANTHTQEEIEKLGLDVYAGTYNKRPIRGGRAWSTHAYGCAIDMFPAKNRMGSSFEEALFSKPEYEKFMNCWREAGFVNLGEALDFDTMHFQYASV